MKINGKLEYAVERAISNPDIKCIEVCREPMLELNGVRIAQMRTSTGDYMPKLLVRTSDETIRLEVYHAGIVEKFVSVLARKYAELHKDMVEDLIDILPEPSDGT